MSRSTRIARAAPVRKLLLEVADLLDELAGEARKTAEDYSWTENTRHDLRMVTDSAKVRTHASDPTGAQALAGRPGGRETDDEIPDRPSHQDLMKRLLLKARRKITAGTSRFREARDLLEEALDLVDPHRRRKDEGTRTTPYPQLVKDEELAAYAGAKERRTARGEDWGRG